MHTPTEQKERPGVGTEAFEAVATKPFACIKGKAEIDLTAISNGSANPRYEVYLAGWSKGFESREDEVKRLRYERDLFYFCYTNKKTPADFYRHQTNELWAEAVR